MRNRKGMALVTLLAFLAVAMLLFAGMITAFQSSVARDKGEFEDQQVLMMANSHMELAKSELSKNAVMQRMTGGSSSGELVSSKYEDIVTKVSYSVGSESCIKTPTNETCTYPVELVAKSSMAGASRTLKAKTSINKITVVSSIPENVKLVIENTLTIQKVDGGRGETLSSNGNGNMHTIGIPDQGDKVFVEIEGTVGYSKGDEQYPVTFVDAEMSKITSTCGTTVSNSCVLTDVSNKTITVNPREKQIVILLVNGNVNLSNVKIQNNGSKNSAVVIAIPKGSTLTFLNSSFTYTNPGNANTRQNMIISDAVGEDTLILDSSTGITINGLIYTPKTTINLGNGNQESKMINGSIVTKTFSYPKSQKDTLKLKHEAINLSLFCNEGSFCPFMGNKTDGGGDDSAPTETITYALGGFKYVK